jgi:hypothetical protein
MLWKAPCAKHQRIESEIILTMCFQDRCNFVMDPMEITC